MFTRIAKQFQNSSEIGIGAFVISVGFHELLKMGSDKMIYSLGKYFFLVGFVSSKNHERLCNSILRI